MARAFRFQPRSGSRGLWKRRVTLVQENTLRLLPQHSDRSVLLVLVHRFVCIPQLRRTIFSTSQRMNWALTAAGLAASCQSVPLLLLHSTGYAIS